MLSRGRDPRGSKPSTPAHLAAVRPQPKAPLARPEPDYEVVEFPSDQYVNAKLQPPPPPPRPPAGHPEAVSPCGLCGGGGARVRCIECGKRPLCASCDEMYHRHPKRRNHHRQVLPFNQQLSDVRPPLPPKVIAPPVPPPRRHKIGGDRMSASPKPPTIMENRRATVGSVAFAPQHLQTATLPLNTHDPHPALAKSIQPKFQPSYMGSMPYLPTHHTSPGPQQTTPIMPQTGTWGRPRGSFPGYLQPNQPPPAEMWESPEHLSPQPWTRPMRRGASVLELNQSMGVGGCGGCGQCVGGAAAWRYGSCQSLENSWGAWPATCCLPPHPGHHPHPHPHSHIHPSHTPQPYRRMESRAASRAGSRAASRAGSRAASPAASTRPHRAASPATSTRPHRARRAAPRTPSPPPPPSSDADSESEGDSDHRGRQTHYTRGQDEDSLGAPPPPPDCTWQCEHCTYVNEPGVRVCAVCCKTPTTAAKVIAEVAANAAKLKISDKPRAPSVINEQRLTPLNGAEIKPQAKERISTGCGPSPPREDKKPTPTTIRENIQNQVKERHDMGVGPSPPKEIRQTTPVKEVTRITRSPVTKHNVSVGPSPPRDNLSRSSLETSSMSTDKRSTETRTSPSRHEVERRPSSRASVANTGTSPPPQSISTQTYEVPSSHDRERASSRSRSRRRFRDDAWRERSHSRHSLSSDTKESSRSGGGVAGRWAWQDQVESPSPRRASLLDLRRTAPAPRYHQVVSAEMISPSNRAMSLETLSAVGRRETERGLELARLMNEAEALGFSAAEVHAALAQNPLAPLSWLKERWGGLVGSVQEAAARLAPGAALSEREARVALARARGAVWPAVTACLHRAQMGVGEEGRLRGRVWGSPAGAELEAAPAARADDSSDEFDGPTTTMHDDDWMYLPLDDDAKPLNIPTQYVEPEIATDDNNDVAYKLKSLLKQAGVPHIDETLLLQGLLAEANRTHPSNNRQNNFFLGQSENDFIEAYNALTRSSPLTTNRENDFIKNQDFDRSLGNDNNHSNETNNLAQLSALTTLAALNTIPSSHSSDVNISTTQQNIKESTSNKTSETKYKSNTDINIVNPRKINQQKHRDTSDSDDEYYTQRKLSNQKKNNDVEQTSLTLQPKSFTNFKNSTDDKPSNLSDIVDHTQKLIQQMKEEIHSDINSLDERNMIRSDDSNNSSQSDVSTEHESSYSESLGDTESGSDEKYIKSLNKELLGEPSQNIAEKLNRTSSEDNEQFEEAMDHIEPIDTFEQTNIHILDSIARSLQTDQVISIENEEQIIQTSNKVGKVRSEDVNNNIFSSVNSFEEIYQELNSDNFNTQTRTEIAREDTATQIQIPTVKKIVYIKEPLNIIQFQSDPISQFQVLDYKDPVHKAVIELIETPLPVPISIPNEIEEKLLPERSRNTKEIHTLVNLIIKDQENISISPLSTQTDASEALSESQNQEPAIANDLSDFEKKLGDQTDFLENTNLAEIDQKRKITGAPSGPTNDNTSKKSNIPKLIKVLQSTKSKLDRHFPKVIASKVPVRRPSLKGHQAPGPPKSHFGNIQSGQVRQLQSQLFNNKVYKPPTKIIIPEPKPTTSSGHIIKKKPAPQPPIAGITNNENMPSPSKTSPTIEEKQDKKTYFRETCRTEDEWSDSDSNSSQVFKRENHNDEPERPRSPPPPLTLRRVSGNLIDLATIRLPEGSPERQARMLLAEGAIETWEQAELAVDLAGRGTDLATALLAALECTDLDSALAYLNQECELCATRLAEHEMVSMLRCTHRCCRECARHYFTVQITERSIIDCVCPYCKEPELESLSEDAWLEYFAHLDILLKTLIEIEVHELFQRKLRDRTLARDPNFRWCVECSSGFFVHPKQKKLRCPECRSISCASCRKPWSVNHEDLTCEEYSAWLEDNDPEKSIAAVQQHLKENGLDCPRCHFKYSLSRGGCMHFTCTQCKFEFCFGCGKPFTMGARCGVSDYCAKLGLHAHHPRNCLFYLRDKEPHELQTLLQMNNVPFESESASGGNNRCPVALQRETPAGLADTTCGADVPPLHAGLCKLHYVEYLAGLARSVDPLPIMDVPELVAELRRRGLALPERGPWDTDPIYAGMCAEIVKEKIPLE